MIFVSVGSMFPFDRMVRAVDDWAGRNPQHELLIQIGNGTYLPANARWVRMLPPGDFQQTLGRSRLFVAHLGMGSLMSGIQAQVPTILMPRLKSLGEHNTDHQRDGARWLRGRQGIWIADDGEQLAGLLDQLSAGPHNQKPQPIAPFASEELLSRVRNFIAGD